MRLELNRGEGSKVSYLPILLKIISLCMSEVPILNASVSPDAASLRYQDNHHFGVAIDSTRGLVVPVLEFVNKKSIAEIAADLSKLQVFIFYLLVRRYVFITADS